MGGARGLHPSMLAWVLPLFMGVVSYGGEQPSEEVWPLGMREVCITTWLTLMVPVGGMCLVPWPVDEQRRVCLCVMDEVGVRGWLHSVCF